MFGSFPENGSRRCLGVRPWITILVTFSAGPCKASKTPTEGSITSRNTIRFRWEEIRDKRFDKALRVGRSKGGHLVVKTSHICTWREVPFDLCKKIVAQLIVGRIEVVNAILLHRTACSIATERQWLHTAVKRPMERFWR